MKFGVLGFSYAGFEMLGRQLQASGAFTVNLGDNAQTIASRHVFRELGVSDADIVMVDRDQLPAYAGEPVSLLMNGVFMPHSFPIPDAVTPIFVGFNAGERVIKANTPYLKRFEPIGCRDRHTEALLKKHGIDAYTTGCVTLTFPKRLAEPATPRCLVVHGSGSGALPPDVLAHAPREVLGNVEFIFHRMPANEYPLPLARMRLAEDHERALLRHYSDHAGLVLTSLHHVAAPCIAMGIPTIIARKDLNERFSLLADIVPVHIPGGFGAIDWSPVAPDVTAIAARFIDDVRRRLAA